MGHKDDMHYIGLKIVCDLTFWFWSNFFFCVWLALVDDNGAYFLNGNNVLLPYADSFSYGGVTLKYTGTDAVIEQVQSVYTRKLTRDLKVQVSCRCSTLTCEIPNWLTDSLCSILYQRLCPEQIAIRTMRWSRVSTPNLCAPKPRNPDRSTRTTRIHRPSVTDRHRHHRPSSISGKRANGAVVRRRAAAPEVGPANASKPIATKTEWLPEPIV